MIRPRNQIDIRPTKDIALKAIFNILEHNFTEGGCEYTALECFSGTGAFSFTGLKKNFNFAVLVEKNKIAAKYLENKIRSLDFSNYCELVNADILNFETDMKFDIVFLDPPYFENLIQKTIRHIRKFTKNETIFIIECHKDEFKDIENALISDELKCLKNRKYGICSIGFFCER